MPVRCPACGFDSPDDASWCDFCKEPFRKKAAAATRTPAPPMPAAQPPAQRPAQPVEAPLDPAVEARLSVMTEQLKSSGDGLKLPSAPRWFKYVAWAVAAAWLVAAGLMAGMFLARSRALISPRAPAAPRAEVPQTPRPLP